MMNWLPHYQTNLLTTPCRWCMGGRMVSWPHGGISGTLSSDIATSYLAQPAILLGNPNVMKLMTTPNDEHTRWWTWWPPDDEPDDHEMMNLMTTPDGEPDDTPDDHTRWQDWWLWLTSWPNQIVDHRDDYTNDHTVDEATMKQPWPQC